MCAEEAGPGPPFGTMSRMVFLGMPRRAACSRAAKRTSSSASSARLQRDRRKANSFLRVSLRVSAVKSLPLEAEIYYVHEKSAAPRLVPDDSHRVDGGTAAKTAAGAIHRDRSR